MGGCGCAGVKPASLKGLIEVNRVQEMHLTDPTLSGSQVLGILMGVRELLQSDLSVTKFINKIKTQFECQKTSRQPGLYSPWG